jgi:ABC-type glycerol-3-phosphate transport system permease component
MVVKAQRTARSAPGAQRTAGRVVGFVLLYVLLLASAVVMLIPFAWTISSSFKDITDIFNFPPDFWPAQPVLSNYTDLFTTVPFARWYINSIMVAAVSTALAVFFSALAGFGFAKYDFPLRGVLFKVLIGTLVVPGQLVLIPLFIMMSKIGWMDSYAALIVPGMAPAFGIFLMRQYMVNSLPGEILDSGRIDGCSEFGLFFRLVVPLIRPPMGALTIFTFLGSWNAFLWPLIILRSADKFTLPIGLQNMLGLYDQQYGMIMAGAFLVALPMILLFIAMQRQFIAGLTVGSVKG